MWSSLQMNWPAMLASMQSTQGCGRRLRLAAPGQAPKPGPMAEFTETLNPDHEAMIARQPVYFVATAAVEGRINVSPKGLADTF